MQHSAAASAHTQLTDHVIADLQSRRSGLNSSEVARRLERYGPNTLPAQASISLWQILWHQFASPLIFVLLVAAGASLLIGDVKDALFIFAVLVLNATIGAFQEYKAERSAESLRSLLAPYTYVLRDAEELEIKVEDLVPGDVVILEAGSKVPADLRLISGSVEIDESLLTGESLPVLKQANKVIAPDASLGDRLNMAYSGTLVGKGRCYGIVTATGLGTELGRIAASLKHEDKAPPPLIHRMERFSKKIALVLVFFILLLAAVMFFRGESLYTIFLGAVSLAVSVIPEGLPVAMTVALAIAVKRMSRRKVIARRLAAVEGLGSCTYIASDKTGTLTINELTIKRVIVPGSEALQVSGQGINPQGEVLIPENGTASGALTEALKGIAEAAVLCNDATLSNKNNEWQGHGDAVDIAFLAFAEKLGITRGSAEVRAPREAALPFDPQRQYAATLNAFNDGLRVCVKGAPERLLPMCLTMTTTKGVVPVNPQAMESRVNALAQQGYRMLAIASGAGKRNDEGEVDPSCLKNLNLLGFVGMVDPVREEVPAAIKACRNAGIEVAMVTGDHPATAFAVASELGLASSAETVVTGPQLKVALNQGQAQLDALVAQSHVFARVEPQQKLHIVQALIRQGHFVAVTGDGANDAPAMRAAHIGVAMGKRGTDVAKDTGELILSDDNFASIVAGIEEGRIAYGNVRKVIFLLISSGAAELVLFTLCIALGLPLPLYPAQILWLNLVTNGIQDVALAFEPAEGGELNRPPRPPKEAIFNPLMIWRTLLSASVMGGLSFVGLVWMLEQQWELNDARNTLLLLLVLFENVQAGNARSEYRSLFRLSPLRNPTLLIGTLLAQSIHIAAMHTPGLQGLLDVKPVSLQLWTVLLVIAISLFVVVELDKGLRRLFTKRTVSIAT